jgi:hypothetical protein
MLITKNLRNLAFHCKLIHSILEDGEVVIDNSSFEALTQCDVKGFLELFLKKKVTRGASALVFGGAFHKALETYYRGASEEASIEAALKEAEEKELNSLEDPKRNLSSLKELIRFYFMDEKLSKNKFVPLRLGPSKGASKGADDLFVEKSFAFHLGDIDITSGTITKHVRVIWTGRIDLCIERLDGIYPVDHKTTSVMGPQFADDKLRSSQMLGYAWGTTKFLEALGDKRPFKGILINAVCMRSRGFERQVYVLPYTKWQLEQWQLETLVILQTTLSRLIHTVEKCFLCPCRTSCVTKYGKCSHFRLCQLSPDAVEQLVLDKEFYKDNDWSPLKED